MKVSDLIETLKGYAELSPDLEVFTASPGQLDTSATIDVEVAGADLCRDMLKNVDFIRITTI